MVLLPHLFSYRRLDDVGWDRILACIGDGGIPTARGTWKAGFGAPGKNSRASFAFYSPRPPLGSLIDLPAVIIGGVRYTRVDGARRLPHDGGFSLRREIVVPSVGRAWGATGRPGSGCGEPAAGVVEDGWLPRRRGRWPMRCSKARRGKRKRARASLAGYRIRAPVSSGWPPWSGLWPLRITRTWKTP